jgi:hypothetical protein
LAKQNIIPSWLHVLQGQSSLSISQTLQKVMEEEVYGGIRRTYMKVKSFSDCPPGCYGIFLVIDTFDARHLLLTTCQNEITKYSHGKAKDKFETSHKVNILILRLDPALLLYHCCMYSTSPLKTIRLLRCANWIILRLSLKEVQLQLSSFLCRSQLLF